MVTLGDEIAGVSASRVLQASMVAVITLLIIFKWRRRKRQSFKGAQVWPLVGALPSTLLNLGRLFDWLTDLAITNGGTFSLPGPWKTWIFTADPANVEYVLKTSYHNFGKGQFFKKIFGDMFGQSIFVQDGEAFKLMNMSVSKAIASPAFCESASATLPVVMDKKLLPVLSRACETGAIVDLQEIFLRLSFDNICLFGVGVDLGVLSPDLPRSPLLEAFREATDMLFFRAFIHPLCWKLLRFIKMSSENRFYTARDLIYRAVAEDIFPRWCNLNRTGSPRSDVLSGWMRFEREKGRLYSDERIHELIVNIIAAGKDTMTAGLSWFFWLLVKHPRVEAKILAELRGIGSDPSGSFTLEQIKRMDYLHAALTESLRLYPPFPLELVEAVGDDVLPDDTPIEKGAQVFYLTYSSGRLESVWGADCLEFKPERWLHNGSFLGESEFKFGAFHGGPRRCMGKAFAYWTMKSAIASILIHYRVKIVDQHPVLPKVGLGLVMKHGLLATIHPREMEGGER